VLVSDVTFGYRGRLPHLVRAGKMYFVTYCTAKREVLSPGARTLVLRYCTAEHLTSCWVDCVMVMPDHVHLTILPYEMASLAGLLGRMKGRASYAVNRVLGRAGPLWQRESFDRIVRSDENLDKKRAYILDNAVRAGLVERREDYPWWWTSWTGAN